MKNKEKRKQTKSTKKYKKNLIVCIIILLLLILLIIISFTKDSSGNLYFDKFKNLFIIQDNIDESEITINSKNDLKDYLQIEDKEGKSEAFKYQYVVFTDKLSNDLYKEFIQIQEEFMNEEQYYLKKELKTIAEIYNDILFIYAVHTSYIEDMPIVDNIYTLNINLENNTLCKLQ